MQKLSAMALLLLVGFFVRGVLPVATSANLRVESLEITNSSGNVVWRLDGELGGSGRGQMKMFSPNGDLLFWVRDVVVVGPRLEMFPGEQGGDALLSLGVLRQKEDGVPDVVSGYLDLDTMDGPEAIKMGVWSDREPRISITSREGRRLLDSGQ